MAKQRLAFCAAGLVSVLAVCLLSSPAMGLVFGDDPNLHVVSSSDANYTGVGFFPDLVPGLGGSGASGVLINPWYVLTARHVTNYYSGAGQTFRLNTAGGTVNYTTAEKFESSTCDLAIVRLTNSTGLAGFGLYTGSTEVGKTATLVGYGMSGTPATVQAGGDPNYPRGVKRIGYNKVDEVVNGGSSGSLLQITFSSSGVTNEAVAALGDSGSPLFISSSGQLKVAGITSGASAADSNHWPRYNDKSYYVRVSEYASWITDQVAATPAPQTGDFDNADGVTVADIDSLTAHYGLGDMWFDTTGDSIVNHADTIRVVHTYLETEFGDADLDGQITLTDYNSLAAHFGLSGSFGWADGDFNQDGHVDFADYQILEANYGFGVVGGAPPIPEMPLPEPASLTLLALGAALFLKRRKSRPFRRQIAAVATTSCHPRATDIQPQR
ncbi:MAG: trypsin-like serine protease [Phycisphaerae bacterium]